MNTSQSATQHSETRAFAIEAARLLADRHCEDVRLLDVRNLSQVCDFVLLGTGTSDRQMKSLGAELEDQGRQCGHTAFRANSDDATTWVVIDFVDLVVHLFEPDLRSYYDLDGLWGDAAEIQWTRDDEPPAAARAGTDDRDERQS